MVSKIINTAVGTTHAQMPEQGGFGAYGASANAPKDLTAALDKPPDSKVNGSLDFTDADKRWLKDRGITTSDPNSYRSAWRTEDQKYRHEHHKWSETTRGRVAMRAVSRGIVGAICFAAGDMYTGHALKGYNLEASPKGGLQQIARLIDNTVGKSIQWTVKSVTGSEAAGLNAIRFRDTRDFGYRNFENGQGRSLGHDAVSITGGFASMTFGDYMTRYFIGLFDPNAEKKWMKDGHIDPPEALKDLLKNVFRGVTYAAGEDMIVAVPYAYLVRGQRNVINKFSPGFSFDSDYGKNGGSFKLNDQIKVVGDYQLEGMLDLMGRFSWYNVGTKMFRDAYSSVATRVQNWWDGDRKLHMPHVDPENFTPANIGLSAAHALRYALRTTIKVMGYMIPATPFFFMTRTPQSKVRGLAIHPEKGVLSRDTLTMEGTDEASQVSNSKSKPIKAGTFYKGGGYNSFEFQIDKLHEYMTSRDITPEQKETLVAHINDLLGVRPGSLLTARKLRNQKDVLKSAVEEKYAYDSDKVDLFLKDLKSKMGDEYPLKGFDTKELYFKELYFRNAKGEKSDLGKITSENYPFDANPQTASRKQAFSNDFYDPNDGRNPPWYSGVTNPIARWCYQAGSNANKAAKKGISKLNTFLKPTFGVEITPDNVSLESFVRSSVNAAISYPAYFMMKTDTLAPEWDTERTDMGLDRSLNGLGTSIAGLVTFNGKEIRHGFGEFKSGMDESRRSLMREPFTDPAREAIAQKERGADDPEHASNEAFQLNGVSKRAPASASRGEHKLFAHDGLKPKSIASATFTQLKTPDSWAVQEAVRKFQDVSPQGHSVH